MNNSTIFTADRATHVKIVVVSLIASILVVAIGIAAHTTTAADNIQTAGPPLKAGKPMTVTNSGAMQVR